ncbi:FAD-binding oxidoreductase [Neobacillus mesonae]|uniref:FAD-binding oxidoreductase n=1 Tax=Neobacillus mesonae TaxID=1193713 RepID=UPI002572E98F|nr:FAD-binding oxidoreductase [Neobacillus mesonae]MED4206378.1 FAD-binding oxidoreductase [Neobacillus mesonae]
MNDFNEKLSSIVGQENVIVDLSSRKQLSKDFYWYSPVLTDMLDDKIADYIVKPSNEEEIKGILSLAVQNKIPVTVRGAGTGNYGQIIPMDGGILIDTTRMNRIIQIEDGSIRVEPGVKLGLVEKNLREGNQELCIYPSTFIKATAGGFVSGGSGGIGSITWGNLWDGNVLELRVLTMEEKPRVLTVKGEDMMNYIHSYGTTGILTEVVFRTTKRVEWKQCIASFSNLENSLIFSEKIAKDSTIKKRSISTCEWPIPSYFQPLEKVIEPEKHIVILEVDDHSFELVKSLVYEHEGTVTYEIPPSNYQKGIRLSDFTWNHTTLWALRANEKMTYLQGSFSLDSYLEQIKLIKEKYKDEFYNHFDWMRSNGEIIPQQIPLVRYKTKEHLYEMISFCESIGVKIFDPHTNLLEKGGWEAYIDSVVQKKSQNDPYGLLNPGKIGVVTDLVKG